MKIELCQRNEIRDFIEKWHYSGSINGVLGTYYFKLMEGDKLIGAMLFGKLGMANVWKRYAENPDEVIELRRLCCVDDTPKNTESFFIGKCVRWLRNNTKIKKIVSYADGEYGHSGIIYQATNFKHIGMTKSNKVIMHNGRRYHDKTIRTTYKGKLKPFAAKIKEALEKGEAQYKQTKPKHIYLFEIQRKVYKKLSTL